MLNGEKSASGGKNSLKTAFINSIGTAVYIALVSLLMTNGNQIFGQTNGVLGGLGILLLFTLSAVIVGTLILGKPLMLYLDGSKKEAVKLLLQTIIILAIITIIFLGILAVISK
jgi:hypothetical protein